MMTKVALAVFATFVASVSAVPVDDAAALSKKLDGLMESVKELKTEMSHADDMDDDVDDMDNDVNEMDECVASKPFRGGDLPCAPYFGTSRGLKPSCRGLPASECPQSYALQKRTKFINGQQKCEGDIFICSWNAEKNRCRGTRFADEQCPAPPSPPNHCRAGIEYTAPHTCADSNGLAASTPWGSYFGEGMKSCSCPVSDSAAPQICITHAPSAVRNANRAFDVDLFHAITIRDESHPHFYRFVLGARGQNQCNELAGVINGVLNNPPDSSYQPVTCDGNKLKIDEPWCSQTMSMFNAKVLSVGEL